MGRTIIQPIGPLYGEAVNGTVFGRPNGSVYVPDSNRITLTLPDTPVVKMASGGQIISVTNNWTAIAQSQDVANYMQRQAFSDAACETMVGLSNSTAGQFNITSGWFARAIDSENPPVVGDTVYLRVQLMSASGVAVATSDVFEVEIQ